MAILLLAEHTNSALQAATGKAVAAAKQLGGDIHVLVAGHNAKSLRKRPRDDDAAWLGNERGDGIERGRIAAVEFNFAEVGAERCLGERIDAKQAQRLP